MTASIKPVEILLVEDCPDDVFFTTETFKQYNLLNKIHVVEDGAEAMDFLYKKGKFSKAPRPGLILLDLNLPKKSGNEILNEIKNNRDLSSIPVVVFTTSSSTEDLLQSYNDRAQCFISKPVDMKKILEIIKSVDDLGLAIVKKS